MNSIQFTPTTSILDVIRAERSELLDPSSGGGSIWRDDPVTLDEYMLSDRFSNLPPTAVLTPVQRESVLAILGEDPKYIFDRERGTGVTVGVFLWGKGAGKDYTASILQSYCTYVVLCLEEPQVYFDQAPGEPLDIINVSYTAEQAKSVYFVKFLERLKRCRWFKQHFDFMQSGRLLAKRRIDSWGVVSIGASTVSFPGNIRAISESSENESSEGYNILVWIMDEASAFRSAKRIANARKIYSTLRSSANTRFIGRWKGIVLSYPRSEDEWDFTTGLYTQSLTDPTMYGSRRFSWEVAPRALYPGGFFSFVHKRESEVITIEVPEILRDEFNSNPEEALAKYCCMPGRSQGAFFELAGAIPKVFVDRPPVFETEEIIVEKWSSEGELQFRGIGHNIVRWNIRTFDRNYQYVIHVDCGLTDDSAALALGHGEPILVEVRNEDGSREKIWTQKVVEDGHIVWVPDRKRNLRVSIRNIETVIVQIAEVVPVSVVTYDRWNSAGSIESLAMKGINAVEHNISREDYDLLKSTVYAGDIELIRCPLTELELSQLRRVENGRVDHPEGGSKDLADALAGIVRLILKDSKGILRKVRSQSVGIPRATLAHSHNASSSSSLSTRELNSVKVPTNSTLGRIPMLDVPPMPFGIGSSGRPRPRIRGLSGESAPSALRDALISSRVRELSR